MSEDRLRRAALLALGILLATGTALAVAILVWLGVKLWTGGSPGSISDLPAGCVRGHSEYHDGAVFGVCDDQR